jgi:hypothetical protein
VGFSPRRGMAAFRSGNRRTVETFALSGWNE